MHFSLYVTVEPSNRLSCRRFPCLPTPLPACLVGYFRSNASQSTDDDRRRLWSISAAMESLFIKISMCIRPIHLLAERHDLSSLYVHYVVGDREGG